MNIISVSAEIIPWSKTGGLGDVCGVLPKALAERGHRVMTVAPYYKTYEDAWDTGIVQIVDGHHIRFYHCRKDNVDHVFVDHPAIRRGAIYGTDAGAFSDNWFRFSLLCRGAILAAMHLVLDGSTYSADTNVPLRFLVHDWHASLLPAYLVMAQQWGMLPQASASLVIHNLAHQGKYPHSIYPQLNLPPGLLGALDMDGNLNFLKGAMVLSKKIITVSPTYAKEIRQTELGMGLEGILRWREKDVHGILNGIDTEEHNPETDKVIAKNFSKEDLHGKIICKMSLQKEVGLPVQANVPLFGFVSRLDAQKGVDLLQEVMPWLLRQGAQVIILGTGAPALEDWVKKIGQHPNVAGLVKFSGTLAKKITAGSDFLLMPSLFEPCGLSQQHALAYGTLPIVHATGGLRDTVHSFHPWLKQGNGWAFAPYSPENLQQALQFALMTYKYHPEDIAVMQRNAMDEERSWTKAAQEYETLLQ